ncbi:hypothetical protein D1007_53589 [Hordeum vulgare]|nr:hypothetical protein D1007_53589 [Hordeum vulgare]
MTRSEQMDLLISTIQGMQKDITDILLNQKSLDRIVKDKFHTLNNKVDELTKTMDELKKKVDAVPIPHTSDDGDDDDDISEHCRYDCHMPPRLDGELAKIDEEWSLSDYSANIVMARPPRGL